MKQPLIIRSVGMLLALTYFTACSEPQAASSSAPQICNNCGIVSSVTLITQEGGTTGTGAVIGAVVGGVAGNQVGGGTGKDIATAAGAIGGALLGNNIERNRNAESSYNIVVDMEYGGQQTVTVQNPGGIGPGSAVTVQGNSISLR